MSRSSRQFVFILWTTIVVLSVVVGLSALFALFYQAIGPAGFTGVDQSAGFWKTYFYFATAAGTTTGFGDIAPAPTR